MNFETLHADDIFDINIVLDTLEALDAETIDETDEGDDE